MKERKNVKFGGSSQTSGNHSTREKSEPRVSEFAQQLRQCRKLLVSLMSEGPTKDTSSI